MVRHGLVGSPAPRYIEEIGLAAMLTTKRSTGVTGYRCNTKYGYPLWL